MYVLLCLRLISIPALYYNYLAFPLVLVQMFVALEGCNCSLPQSPVAMVCEHIAFNNI